ncbi:MAG: DNA repair protein RecN [Nitrospinales bacterium]
MLKELKITNFAVIENLAVQFRPGFNVLTGETGAGKSILIDALTLALGGRADTDNIRTGRQTAAVEALFYVDDPGILEQVRQLGIEVEDGQLIIKRQVSLSEKNRAFLNGGNITVGALAAIGNRLVDIHGQHDHQTLLHPENHLGILDLYGGLVPEKERFEREFADYRDLDREYQSLLTRERDRRQREDLLNFQLDEIDRANLSPSEEDALRTEQTRLLNAEKTHQALQRALNLLMDNEGAVREQLGQVDHELKQPAQLDPDLQTIADRAQSLSYEVEDLVETLRAYGRDNVFQPERLEEIDDRLAEINTLKRKYGGDIPAVLESREQIAAELQALSSNQERVEALTADLARRRQTLAKQAVALAEKREKAAARLQKSAEKELRELNMPKTRFGARFNYEPDPDGFVTFRGDTVRVTPDGLGVMEFLFSPNPGEDLRPLAKIASGGELSRVMLALKTILNEQDPVPVLIFDEVDSGIGGKVAEKVGVRLKQIAARRQVFCVTHLPQIAGMAATHFSIHKQVEGKRTRTSIRELSLEDRIEEIARMSGGEKITETTRQHAREMVKPG